MIMSQTEGIYACYKPDNNSKKIIAEIIKQLKLENSVRLEDLHSTVIYSESYTLDLTFSQIVSTFKNIILPMYAKISGFSIFDMSNGEKCLVLNLDSLDLHLIHNVGKRYFGATYSHETYNPHITICYDYKSDYIPLISDLENISLDIMFDDSVIEHLKE